MELRRVADPRAFARAPIGSALVGDGWLHFCAHAQLFGVVLWGRPGAEPIAALVRSLRSELGDEVPPHRSIVDASRLEAVDAGAFEVLNRYVSDEMTPLARAVTRLALVRPSGLAGAVTSGFYAVSGTPYPVRLFDETRPALAWLGEETAVADVLDRLVEEVTGTPAVVSRVEAALATQLATIDLATAARALGMSARTLQRRLRDAGTSFAAVLLDLRLREAQRRMRDTDEPLGAIAFEVGFSSQQHFSTAFREATGEPPSAWRRRHRPQVD